MDIYDTFNKYLANNGIVHFKAKEDNLIGKYGYPSRDKWRNIIPTLTLLEDIRLSLRNKTGEDLIIKVNSAYRDIKKANGSKNHYGFYAIDFLARIRRGGKVEDYPTSELAKIVWNYYIKFKNIWRLGVGYYPKGSDPKGVDNFIHIDTFQRVSYRPSAWEEYDKWEERKVKYFDDFILALEFVPKEVIDNNEEVI